MTPAGRDVIVGVVRVVLIALVLFAIIPVQADAADRTTLLLQELDRCDYGVPASMVPKLDVLLDLADGLSAQELGTLLRGGQRRCIGGVTWYGAGADELVFVGGLGDGLPTGALLWVDRGYWRAAAVPFGYWSGTSEVRRVGVTRELLAGIGSGGSAGNIGVLGIRIVGATASVTMRLVPGGEIGAEWLDDDHIYVHGRITTDPLFRWGSHPSWPYGAQWLFERQGESFVEVAHRQSRDPEWVGTGFIGALRNRDADTMRRFATDDAVAQALALPTLDVRIAPLTLFTPGDFLERERMSWDVLPGSVRMIAPTGPVWGVLRDYDDHVRFIHQVVLRFDRVGDGWVVTDVDPISLCGYCEPRLTP